MDDSPRRRVPDRSTPVKRPLATDIVTEQYGGVVDFALVNNGFCLAATVVCLADPGSLAPARCVVYPGVRGRRGMSTSVPERLSQTLELSQIVSNRACERCGSMAAKLDGTVGRLSSEASVEARALEVGQWAGGRMASIKRMTIRRRSVYTQSEGRNAWIWHQRGASIGRPSTQSKNADSSLSLVEMTQS
jgi:hypothetical protein